MSEENLLEKISTLNNELISTQRELQRKNAELERANDKLKQALSEIKVLKGLIPQCSHCKKVRDENEQWMELEKYIIKATDSNISHGVCDECMKIHYSEYY